jgi:hypothetical protein
MTKEAQEHTYKEKRGQVKRGQDSCPARTHAGQCMRTRGGPNYSEVTGVLGYPCHMGSGAGARERKRER